MSLAWKRWRNWGAGMLACLTVGCGGPEDEKGGPGESRSPLYECGEELSGEFDASAWVREVSDIRRYRYTVAADRESVEFELVGEEQGGASLAEMTVGSRAIGETEKNLVPDVDREQRVLVAELRREGVEPVALEAIDNFGPDGVYRVFADLERQGRRFHVVAAFGESTCEPPPAPIFSETTSSETASSETTIPECVGYVPLGDRRFVLPSCGARRDQLAKAPFPTSLIATSLTYFAQTDASMDERDDAGVTLSGDTRFASMRVLERGRLVDGEAVETWADAVGADAILGSDAGHLLTVAFLDEPWRQQVREHTNYCEAPDLFPEASGALFPEASGALCPNVERDGSGGSEGRKQQAISGPGGCIRNFGSPFAGMNPRPFEFECKGPGCRGYIWGDPHMETHDGVAFDFQGAGEYIVAESSGAGGQGGEASPLMLQARFEPIGGARDIPACRNVSVMTAVAAKVGDRRIGIYGRHRPALYVDGQPHNLGVDTIELPEGARLSRQPDGRYLVGWPDGTAVLVARGGNMSLRFRVTEAQTSRIRGLLGDANGVTEDDFRTRDGTILGAPPGFEQLYGVFGESWRVRDAESLFDYFDGEGPGDFNDPSFPEGPTTFEGVPEEREREARETCSERPIADAWMLDACLLDFICTSDPTTADNAGEALDPLAVVEPQFALFGQLRQAHRAEDLRTPETGDGQRCEAPLRTAFVVEEALQLELEAPLMLDEPAVELPAGTTVSSYFVHLPEGVDATAVEGRIVFNREVAGIVRLAEGNVADSRFADPDFGYPDGPEHGLEDPDFVYFGEDGRSVGLRLEGTTNADQFRVLVKEVSP